jgi:hypothetical protein
LIFQAHTSLRQKSTRQRIVKKDAAPKEDLKTDDEDEEDEEKDEL